MCQTVDSCGMIMVSRAILLAVLLLLPALKLPFGTNTSSMESRSSRSVKVSTSFGTGTRKKTRRYCLIRDGETASGVDL